IEISLDRHDATSISERLRHLSARDLACGQDHRATHPGAGGVGGRGGGSVASRCADERSRAALQRFGDGYSHPAVLKRTSRIDAFIFYEDLAPASKLLAQTRRINQWRAAFA